MASQNYTWHLLQCTTVDKWLKFTVDVTYKAAKGKKESYGSDSLQFMAIIKNTVFEY